ncbi:pyridoxal phosphate-dependent aminotransferase [bacterium]|nr:pyridoxal phosphate-dependent aminotransferase [bacterium]
MRLSTRAYEVPPSPIRKLVPFADEAKRRGLYVYHINIGQPDIETPQSFWKAVHSYPAKVLEYGNSKGLPEYRKYLAKYYQDNGIDVDSEHLIVTTGGSEAIMFAMLAVTDPGDNIIVFEPFYTNYNGYAVMTDIQLKPVTTKPETGYHLPPEEEIEAKIDERTRAILVCSPNNPTGTVLTEEELKTIARIAERHDLFVIADEVYREFVYEGRHTSILHLPELSERGIIVDSISKRFSACGARIGAVVSKNDEVIEAITKMAQARLCPPTIEQYAAQAVLMQLTEDYFRRMVEEYRRRRDATYEELMKIPGVVCEKPSGAFYIMAKLPLAEGKDVEQFAKFLLTDFEVDGKTVMVAPGPGFYATPGLGNTEIRIAYVLESEKMRDAIRILAAGLEKFNSLP